MSRMFWFAAGATLGIVAYRYLEQNNGQVPGFESLGESGRKLTDSGRQFADAGRRLAESGREFAQAAADTAKTRGQDMMNRGQDMVSRGQNMVNQGQEAASKVVHQADLRGTDPAKTVRSMAEHMTGSTSSKGPQGGVQREEVSERTP